MTMDGHTIQELEQMIVLDNIEDEEALDLP
jgi:hypothetical protein